VAYIAAHGREQGHDSRDEFLNDTPSPAILLLAIS